MKYILFLIIIGCLFSCNKAEVVSTESEGVSAPWVDTSSKHPKAAQFDALLKKYKQKGLPGISLLIRDSKGTWFGASGKADIKSNISFKPGTVSKTASITKLLIGALVFKLMEDSANTKIGFNDLQTKVSKWIPDAVLSKIANGREITLGQCMKHETGIPDIISESKFYLAVLNNPNKKWGAEELLSYIYEKPALFKQGNSAAYSNTNTILVSMVIEAQTGRKHSDLLHELIFRPLAMNQTYYHPHDVLPANVAQAYFDLYNNNAIVNVSNLITGNGNGYVGVYSNLFDLYNFANALFINQTLLKPSSLQLMQTYEKRDGSNYYGYGLQKSYLDNGIDFGIGHKGRDLGYSANLFYFPNKKVLHILFVNYGTDAKSNLREVFSQFVDEMIAASLN
ncbi:MAG: beta-lactamase family protein [Chitinophagaceae bacterium]|nr:beta-lactamase family protein [Chitinophagaceae bacterium]